MCLIFFCTCRVVFPNSLSCQPVKENRTTLQKMSEAMDNDDKAAFKELLASLPLEHVRKIHPSWLKKCPRQKRSVDFNIANFFLRLFGECFPKMLLYFVVSGEQLLPKWISQDLQRKYSLWCCEARQSWLRPYSFGLWVTTEYPVLPKTSIFSARVDATIRAEDSFCNPLESAADDNSVEILAIFAECSKQNRVRTKAKLLMLMIKCEEENEASVGLFKKQLESLPLSEVAVHLTHSAFGYVSNMWYAYKLKLSHNLFHSRTMWTSVTMDFCSTLLCPRAWRSTSNFSSSRG